MQQLLLNNTCRLCDEIFDFPISLPCGHLVCGKHNGQLADECPICKLKFKNLHGFVPKRGEPNTCARCEAQFAQDDHYIPDIDRKRFLSENKPFMIKLKELNDEWDKFGLVRERLVEESLSRHLSSIYQPVRDEIQLHKQRLLQTNQTMHDLICQRWTLTLDKLDRVEAECKSSVFKAMTSPRFLNKELSRQLAQIENNHLTNSLEQMENLIQRLKNIISNKEDLIDLNELNAFISDRKMVFIPIEDDLFTFGYLIQNKRISTHTVRIESLNKHRSKANYLEMRSRDGIIKTFKCHRNEITKHLLLSDGSDGCQSANEQMFVTVSCLDQKVKLWSFHSSNSIIECVMNVKEYGIIEELFQMSESTFACAFKCGKLSLFDFKSTHSKLNEFNMGVDITCLLFDWPTRLLFSSHLNGHINIWTLTNDALLDQIESISAIDSTQPQSKCQIVQMKKHSNENLLIKLSNGQNWLYNLQIGTLSCLSK